MTNQQQNEKHTTAQSVLLHLFPGILIGGFYFLAWQPVKDLGYPSIFTLMLAIAFVLVPVELGYLLSKGKQKTGRYTLKGIISYRVSIPWWQYIIWVLMVLIMIGVIFTVLKPLDNILMEKLYFWFPTFESGLDGNFSKTALIVTYITMLVFGVVVGPLVEELYFRGYLLERMTGKYAALMHTFLFGLYHLWTPWMFFTRTVGILPLVYAVKKKNIYIGIIVHVLMNSIDAIAGFAFIANMA